MNKETGVLVDKLIFESYKNKVLKGSEEFRKMIKKNYGYDPSYDLYRKIINYQIEKYGEQLDNQASINYTRARNHRVRLYDTEREQRRYVVEKKLRQLEDEERRKQKSI